MRDGFADALKGVPIAEEYRDHATETQGPKPISTSFLDDERPAIEHQQAEAPNAFPKDEQPPSEILARGLDALTRTAPKDVEDLRLTIVNELVAAKMPEREFATWHNSCDARASEK